VPLSDLVHVAVTNTRGQSETEFCNPAISEPLSIDGGVACDWFCALLLVVTSSNINEIAAIGVHCDM
jgi:hypothetical protein